MPHLMGPLYLLAALAVPGVADEPAENRALAYLAREVPRWAAANHCYSCHNNGDAARALYVAMRLSPQVPDQALADTTRWLAHPERWDRNGGEGAASDKLLARIQFAAALLEALDAGRLTDRRPLVRSADQLARDQRADGSWKVGADGTPGSPATYGTCLATHLARRTLRRADATRFGDAIARADRWLRQVRVVNVLDAAAVVLAVEGADDADARRQRRRCLELIRKGQGEDGGWGPYVASPSEPFDTAVVLLALAPFKEQPAYKYLVRRGRGYLVSTQRHDGSWAETTRPPGAESYAQRLSTAGWATLALLQTSPRTPGE
jgi:squalene cyclase